MNAAAKNAGRLFRSGEEDGLCGAPNRVPARVRLKKERSRVWSINRKSHAAAGHPTILDFSWKVFKPQPPFPGLHRQMSLTITESQAHPSEASEA